MSTEYVESEILTKWIESKDDQNDSWQATCRRAGVLFIQFLEDENIEPTDTEFRYSDIEDFKDYINDNEELAGNTVKNYCMAARDLIKYAYTNRCGWDAVFNKGDPFSIYEADIQPEKNSRWEEETGEDIAYIKKEEHETLLEENANQRDDVLLRTLWDTGVRSAELRRLKKSEINKKELIENRKLIVDTAKRDDHTRPVYLSPTTRQRWVFWLYKGRREAYSTEARSSDYVFPTERSKKMSHNTINLQIKRLAERTGIQEVGYEQQVDQLLDGEYKNVTREYVRINSKSYRAAFIVRACKNGINLELLSELTGHESVDSLEPYTRFLPDDVEDAWEQFIH